MSPPLISLLGRLVPGPRQARPARSVHVVQQPAVSSPERASLEAGEQEHLTDFLCGRLRDLRDIPDLAARRAAVTTRVDEADEAGRTLDGFFSSLSDDADSVLDRVGRLARRASAVDTPPALARHLRGEAHLILKRAQERWAVLEDRFVAAVRLDRNGPAQSEQEEA